MQNLFGGLRIKSRPSEVLNILIEEKHKSLIKASLTILNFANPCVTHILNHRHLSVITKRKHTIFQ